MPFDRGGHYCFKDQGENLKADGGTLNLTNFRIHKIFWGIYKSAPKRFLAHFQSTLSYEANAELEIEEEGTA